MTLSLASIFTRPKPDPLDEFTQALLEAEQGPSLTGLPLTPRSPHE